MKKIFPFSVLLILFSGSVFSQGQDNSITQGIYKTSEDFISRKVIPAKKILLHHFNSSHYLDIVQSEKKLRINKDSTFGYRDKTGKNYRFYKMYNDEYEILENVNLVIYVIYNPTHTSKGISPPYIPSYYFSKTLDSDIFPLSIRNLKKAYPDNIKFHDLLDTEFTDGKAVSAYDDVNKSFKVNVLLKKSIN
jgi:hypothetical protein